MGGAPCPAEILRKLRSEMNMKEITVSSSAHPPKYIIRFKKKKRVASKLQGQNQFIVSAVHTMP